MMGPLIALRSPAGRKARLAVLIFHRVLPTPDELYPETMHARQFDAICGWMAQWFNVLPLDDAARRLRAGTLPERAACITFDDGYADNQEIALPILHRHGLNATFFVATSCFGSAGMFNDAVLEILRACRLDTLDVEGLGVAGPSKRPLTTPALRREAIEAVTVAIKYRPPHERAGLTRELQQRARVTQVPPAPMMVPEQVLALRDAGMRIGAHTVTHPILARMTESEARAEIVGSRDTLQTLLGEPVTLFAFPNGKPDDDYSAATVQLVREAGFEASVCTSWGAASGSSDLFQLPRFTPWDSGRLPFGFRLLRHYSWPAAVAAAVRRVESVS